VKLLETPLQGCKVLLPKVFIDSRGFFVETFRENEIKTAINYQGNFVQDNHSRSSIGVLRGIHFQEEFPQGKLVKVSRGKVFDVAVDLRKESKTFGMWHGEILDDISHKLIWIPPGFGHAFLVLSSEADFVYKCTDYYIPECEKTIIWNDKTLNINWPKLAKYTISKRDLNAPTLHEYLGNYSLK